MTQALRTLLLQQPGEHERLKQAGHIFPNVFFREVADGRGGERSRRRSCPSPRRGRWRVDWQDAPAAFRTTCDERRYATLCAPGSQSTSR
jgi:hypothetical protein